MALKYPYLDGDRFWDWFCLWDSIFEMVLIVGQTYKSLLKKYTLLCNLVDALYLLQHENKMLDCPSNVADKANSHQFIFVCF